MTLKCFACLFISLATFAAVPPATATVTVYRPKRLYGAMSKPSIYRDGVELDRMRNGRFLTVTVPVGQHMITAGRSEVGQWIDFKPGESYFFELRFHDWVTGFSGVPPVILDVVSEDKARTEMHGLKDNRRK